jgi:phage terminase large subunit GpA-like protein
MTGLPKALRRIAEILPTPPPLTISAWSEKEIYLPREGNAEAGKYKLSRMPYQAAMLNDPLDPEAVETFWEIGSQLGKTLCLILINGYFAHHAPTSVLNVRPTLDSAMSWMREKLLPLFRACPSLKNLLREPRERDSESTSLNRKFPGGHLSAVGANSVATLRQRSIKIIIQDEIDAFEMTSEGDPLALADRAAMTFFDAVKLKSSTPTHISTSRIHSGFEVSDKQFYFVPCCNCGALQHLKWGQFKFSFAQPDGKERRDTERAVYECEACHKSWSDAQRIAAINSGHPDNPAITVNGVEYRAKWIATAPFKGIRGRHLNGLYRTIGLKRAFKNYHHEFAEDFLKAKKNGTESLRVWTNIFLAEPWKEKAQQLEWGFLLNRVEKYEHEIPEEVVLLTAAMDIQDDRAEIEVQGIGDEEEVWSIEKFVVWGDFDKNETQEQCDDFLSKKFKHASGNDMGITCVAVDSGHKTKAVYRFTKARQHRRFYAVKGSATPHAPLVTPHKNKHYGIYLFSVGTDTAKESLASRLTMDEPGPRYIHFPVGRGYTELYFKQLCSERLVTTIERGVVRQKWEKKYERNEALDLKVYNMAALDILRPNIARLRKNIFPVKTEAQEKTDYEIKPFEKPNPDPTLVEPPKIQPRKRLSMQVGGVGRFGGL